MAFSPQFTLANFLSSLTMMTHSALSSSWPICVADLRKHRRAVAHFQSRTLEGHLSGITLDLFVDLLICYCCESVAGTSLCEA